MIWSSVMTQNYYCHKKLQILQEEGDVVFVLGCI